MKSIYDISIHKLDGSSLDLGQFKGKKLLIVNVASACGYTPQYKQLQELYEKFNSKLEIIGVPCNDFGAQEPGSAQEIQQFCEKNFGVTFTLTEKVGILQNTHPLYQWLMNQSENGHSDNEVKWNFFKFLVDENGQLKGAFSSGVSPFDESLLNQI
jgi:glutathione peroxidase